ncbi:MAG: hypothetical protein Q9217_001224 [Psora testacea]
MRSITSTAAAISLYLLLAHAQNVPSQASLRQHLDCQSAHLYQQPNASNVYDVKAINPLPNPGTDGTVNNTSMADWALTTVLGKSNDIYAADHHPTLEQAIFLDTSSTLKSSSSAADLGIGGCSLIFSLPLSDLANDDGGNCTSVLDDECVSDFTAQALAQAQSIAKDGERNLTISEACLQMSRAVTTLPKSCSKYQEKDSQSIGNGVIQYSALEFLPPVPTSNLTDCTLPSTNETVPSRIFTRSVPFTNPMDYTIYDQWYNTIMPVMLAVFSNTTSGLQHSKPYADVHLTCTRPKIVGAQSRVPPVSNAAEGTADSVGKVKRVNAHTLRTLTVLDAVLSHETVMAAHHTDRRLAYITDRNIQTRLKDKVAEKAQEIEGLNTFGDIEE